MVFLVFSWRLSRNLPCERHEDAEPADPMLEHGTRVGQKGHGKEPLPMPHFTGCAAYCQGGGGIAVNVTACLLATDLCNIGLMLPYQASGMNPYDMRIKCAVPPLCYDFSNVGVYLARPEVKQALGVDPKRKWSDCNRAVTIQFELSGDWMKDYQVKSSKQRHRGV